MKTVIGPQTRIAGPLSGKDDLEVHGTVDGPVHGDASVTIAAGARIGGEVRGRDVIVGGELEHAVIASGLVRLLATARLTGDIEAPRIAIDEGAVFDGQIRMRKKSATPAAGAALAAAAAPVAAGPIAAAPIAAAPIASAPLAATPLAATPLAATPIAAAPMTPHVAVPSPPVQSVPAVRAIPELAAPGRKPLIRKSS